MSKHVFKSSVIHNGKLFVTGEECPESLHKEMAKKDLIKPLQEAVKPGEALSASDKALKEAEELKAKAVAEEKAKADAEKAKK